MTDIEALQFIANRARWAWNNADVERDPRARASYIMGALDSVITYIEADASQHAKESAGE